VQFFFLIFYSPNKAFQLNEMAMEEEDKSELALQMTKNNEENVDLKTTLQALVDNTHQLQQENALLADHLMV
jgi:hypothetical protein